MILKVLLSPSWYLAELFLSVKCGYKHFTHCAPSMQQRIKPLCLKRKMYSWFSHACHDRLLISELFSFRFSAFDFRHHRRTAGKSVKQQSRVVTIGKKKKKKTPYCKKTVRGSPMVPFHTETLSQGAPWEIARHIFPL